MNSSSSLRYRAASSARTAHSGICSSSSRRPTHRDLAAADPTRRVLRGIPPLGGGPPRPSSHGPSTRTRPPACATWSPSIVMVRVFGWPALLARSDAPRTRKSSDRRLLPHPPATRAARQRQPGNTELNDNPEGSIIPEHQRVKFQNPVDRPDLGAARPGSRTGTGWLFNSSLLHPCRNYARFVMYFLGKREPPDPGFRHRPSAGDVGEGDGPGVERRDWTHRQILSRLP
jgi:hypothetical protein